MRFSLELILLFICSLSVITIHAADTEKSNGAEIRKLLSAKDLNAIRKYAEQLERNWSETYDLSYFDSMFILCSEIFNYTKSASSEEYELLQQFVGCALVKRNIGTSEISQHNFMAMLNQQKGLAELLLAQKNEDISNFEKFRSRNTRILMVFLKVIQDQSIPNFKPLIAYANVNPPINYGNDFGLCAGMDPNVINDPRTRTAYENAIAENQKNIKINFEQNILAKTSKRLLFQLEQYLRVVYSKKPILFLELNEYMILGMFDDKSRTQILNAIANDTRVPMPVGIIPRSIMIDAESDKK